jgi:hypothetical protein
MEAGRESRVRGEVAAYPCGLRGVENTMNDRKESVAASGAPSGRLLMLPKHLPARRSCRRVSNEEAQKKYPNGWKAPKPYLRIASQPK